MEKVIHITKNILGKGFGELFDLLDQQLQPDSPSIVLDLTSLTFVEPTTIVVLAEIYIALRGEGYSLNLIPPNKKDVQNYLQSINFYHYIHTDSGHQSDVHGGGRHTTLQLWRVEKERMHAYSNLVKQFLQDQMPDKDFTPFELCIVELLNNVYDHADSQTGAFAFAQHYPKKKQIEVVISDLGVGIVNKIKAATGKNLTATQALEWALIQGNTVQTHPRNRGFGLDNVKSTVMDRGGVLKIFTNGAILTTSTSSNQVSITNNYLKNFKGTTVVVTLNTDNLPGIESGSDDFDFWL